MLTQRHVTANDKYVFMGTYMQLHELFNTRRDWQIEHVDSTVTEYYVTVEGTFYTITFTLWYDNGIPKLGITSGNVWEVDFLASTGPGGKDPYGILGTGNAPLVFGVVVEAMKHFAAKRRVDYYCFSAKEPSRRRLYDRMVARLGQLITTIDDGYALKYIVKV